MYRVSGVPELVTVRLMGHASSAMIRAVYAQLAPLPWDFVQQHYDRATLRRAYDAMMRRLDELDALWDVDGPAGP